MLDRPYSGASVSSHAKGGIDGIDILKYPVYLPEFCVRHLESFPDRTPKVNFFSSTLGEGTVGEIGQLLDVLNPYVHSRLPKDDPKRRTESCAYNTPSSISCQQES